MKRGVKIIHLNRDTSAYQGKATSASFLPHYLAESYFYADIPQTAAIIIKSPSHNCEQQGFFFLDRNVFSSSFTLAGDHLPVA